MKLKTIAAIAGIAFAMSASAATAAPLSGLGNAGTNGATQQNLLVKVHGIHRACMPGRFGWHRSSPRKRHIACRPFRPRGAGWTWRSQGPRQGWYNRQHRRWHN
ncbi:MAG: hypothetical protein KDJ37_04355 [Hyphomicrobiaceae bacterium]|nr:hypothetical protein [Hyphomicrobiaceae bacterium]